jgi:hypothetical protein
MPDGRLVCQTVDWYYVPLAGSQPNVRERKKKLPVSRLADQSADRTNLPISRNIHTTFEICVLNFCQLCVFAK